MFVQVAGTDLRGVRRVARDTTAFAVWGHEGTHKVVLQPTAIVGFRSMQWSGSSLPQFSGSLRFNFLRHRG